ncbi:hypothetical protein VNI00_012703 [Paramarasmius palmivorus]|uniref:Uncharacterized protein n=1 Tax=Paramarasmius palmivorus TaxID=297713 RepID=A0AAW0C3H6_9AGAR
MFLAKTSVYDTYGQQHQRSLARVNLHLSDVDSNGGLGNIQRDQINNFYKNENKSRAFECLAQKAALPILATTLDTFTLHQIVTQAHDSR